jgi:hypothetical protein
MKELRTRFALALVLQGSRVRVRFEKDSVAFFGCSRALGRKEKRAEPVAWPRPLIFRRCVSPSVCPSLYPWVVCPFPCPSAAFLFRDPVDAPQDVLPVPVVPRDAQPDDQRADRQDVQLVLELVVPPVSALAPGVPSGDPQGDPLAGYWAAHSVGRLSDPQAGQSVSASVPGVPSDDPQVDPLADYWAAHSVCRSGDPPGDSQAARDLAASPADHLDDSPVELRSAPLPADPLACFQVERSSVAVSRRDHSAVHSADCPAGLHSAALPADPLACFQVERRSAAVSRRDHSAVHSGDCPAGLRSAALPVDPLACC